MYALYRQRCRVYTEQQSEKTVLPSMRQGQAGMLTRETKDIEDTA